jgi:FtsP/CotA-like multicopper oxidase with cupredoxin domain
MSPTTTMNMKIFLDEQMVLWLLFFLFVGSVLCEVREYHLEIRSTVWKADGYPRSVLGFFLKGSPIGTQPFPGPLIRGRQNDTFRVYVTNRLHDELTSVHWHGLHMKNNAWQDGTPGITDCGIRPGATRLYEFVVSQVGTFWYHSHSGGQYSDGLLGPMVIDGDEDEMKYGYVRTDDHILMLQDWVKNKLWRVSKLKELQ